MRHYLIYGAARSGIALWQMLKQEAIVHITDDAAGTAKCPVEGVISVSDAMKMLGSVDTLIVSPGVPRENTLIALARSLRKQVVGEFEFSFARLKARSVAVTGTNGKTTVTELIYHILTNVGQDAALLGNGGVPLATRAEQMSAEQIAVLEVSSFQLEEIRYFRPQISVLLNLSPDHIDRHKSMANYIKCKENVFRFQKEGDTALFNADDELVRLSSKKCTARALFFSAIDPNADCSLCADGILRFNFDGGGNESSVKVKNEPLLSVHNRSNAAAAALAARLLGVSTADISRAISVFKLSAHRLELAGEVCGVKFYDDSKATNIHAAAAALQNFSNVCLIAGGSDKGYEFDDLFAAAHKFCFVAVIGETAPKILAAAARAGYGNITKCDSLESAVRECFLAAKGCGASVLLSPACASFDMFQNYEKRGEAFKKYVRELKNEFKT